MLKSAASRLAERRGIDVHLRSEPQLRQYRQIARAIAAERPGRLLDWGCGFGQMTRLLADEGVDVTAFDYRPDADAPGIEPLERFPGLVAHVGADPVRLPFADGEFDSVLSLGVLEHVHDPDGSLEEIRRVLRPGGRFYVYKLPNRLSYLERVAKLLGLYYHGRLPDDRVYSLREAIDLVERHGYVVRRARRADMLPLTAGGPAGALLAANRILERVPGLSLFATNLELVADRS